MLPFHGNKCMLRTMSAAFPLTLFISCFVYSHPKFLRLQRMRYSEIIILTAICVLMSSVQGANFDSANLVAPNIRDDKHHLVLNTAKLLPNISDNHQLM